MQPSVSATATSCMYVQQLWNLKGSTFDCYIMTHRLTMHHRSCVHAVQSQAQRLTMACVHQNTARAGTQNANLTCRHPATHCQDPTCAKAGNTRSQGALHCWCACMHNCCKHAAVQLHATALTAQHQELTKSTCGSWRHHGALQGGTRSKPSQGPAAPLIHTHDLSLGKFLETPPAVLCATKKYCVQPEV